MSDPSNIIALNTCGGVATVTLALGHQVSSEEWEGPDGRGGEEEHANWDQFQLAILAKLDTNRNDLTLLDESLVTCTLVLTPGRPGNFLGGTPASHVHNIKHAQSYCCNAL